VDPKAVEYIHQSSYVFADNDPVGKVDVNGEGTEGQEPKFPENAKKGDRVQTVSETGIFNWEFDGKGWIGLGGSHSLKPFEVIEDGLWSRLKDRLSKFASDIKAFAYEAGRTWAINQIPFSSLTDKRSDLSEYGGSKEAARWGRNAADLFSLSQSIVEMGLGIAGHGVGGVLDLGGFTLSVGVAVHVASAVTFVHGSAVFMNSIHNLDKDLNDGSSRGSGKDSTPEKASDDVPNERVSTGDIKRMIKKKQSPKSIDRVDDIATDRNGKPLHNGQREIHFGKYGKDGSLNENGVWKHKLDRELTNSEREFLRKIKWTLPK